jgi:hypothetical protein
MQKMLVQQYIVWKQVVIQVETVSVAHRSSLLCGRVVDLGDCACLKGFLGKLGRSHRSTNFIWQSIVMQVDFASVFGILIKVIINKRKLE